MKEVKTDLKYLGIALITIVMLIVAAFYKENFMFNLRLAIYLFLSFVLPGYLFLSILLDGLKSYEKIILGMATWMGVSGIGFYYLNWFGVSSRILTFIFPLISIIILAAIYFKKNLK